MKALSIRAQIKLAPKYALFIEGAGYLADKQNLSGILFTHNINKAMKYAMCFDNEDQKLSIWNAEAQKLFNNANVTFTVKYIQP